MLVRREVLKVASAFAGSGERYSLNALLVEPDGAVVATDGHRLVRFGKNGAPPPEDMPGHLGTAPAYAGKVMVPREIAEKVEKLKGYTLPCLGYAAVGPDAVVTTDLETTQRHEFKAVEGSFPRYENVMPKTEPKFSALYNAEYLVSLLRAFIQTRSGKGDVRVRLEFRKGGGPLVIRRDDDVALVMPMQE